MSRDKTYFVLKEMIPRLGWPLCRASICAAQGHAETVDPFSARVIRGREFIDAHPDDKPPTPDEIDAFASEIDVLRDAEGTE